MAEQKTYRIGKLLKLSVAMLLAAGVLVLSVAAVGSKEKEKLSAVQVKIQNAGGQSFVSEKEVVAMLQKSAGKDLTGKSFSELNLAALETDLMKHRWIRKADLYIDNRNTLRVNIVQQIPVARIFTASGTSFYLSDDGAVLPVMGQLSARLPIFTSYTGNVEKLRKVDSTLLHDVGTMATFIAGDPFWMSQIDQVDITSAGTFEMIPKLGNQIIRFGDAAGYAEKFRKLFAFYKQVMVKTGWNKYAVIDLQYKGQIVAEKRDAAEVKADSLAAIRIMKGIIENAKKNAADTTFIQLPDKAVTQKIKLTPKPQVPEDDDTISEIIPEKPSRPQGSVSPINYPEKNDGNDNERIVPKAVMADRKAETSKAPEPKPVREKDVAKPPVKKQPDVKSGEKPKPEKRTPKAIMPSKNN